MNEYKQLQAIYEGWQGLSRDTAPNDRYTATASHISYKALPFNAGGHGNAYASNSDAPRTRIIVPGESEEEISGTVSKQVIVSKIIELQNAARSYDMEYCVHTLGTLIEFIKEG